jgi:hypothetical protein
MFSAEQINADDMADFRMALLEHERAFPATARDIRDLLAWLDAEHLDRTDHEANLGFHEIRAAVQQTESGKGKVAQVHQHGTPVAGHQQLQCWVRRDTVAIRHGAWDTAGNRLGA